MPERRHHIRTLIDARVRIYHSLFGALEGRIIDISEGGCCVVLENMPDIQDELLIQLQDNEDEFITLRPVNMDVVFRMRCLRKRDDNMVLTFEDCEEGTVSADAL